LFHRALSLSRSIRSCSTTILSVQSIPFCSTTMVGGQYENERLVSGSIDQTSGYCVSPCGPIVNPFRQACRVSGTSITLANIHMCTGSHLYWLISPYVNTVFTGLRKWWRNDYVLRAMYLPKRRELYHWSQIIWFFIIYSCYYCLVMRLI
jgi:hypothetical protein